MRSTSVGLCEPHGRALAGSLPFVTDASAIPDLNFNSWPASFQVKELLREEVHLSVQFAKTNKVLWTRNKMAAVQARAGNLLMCAGGRKSFTAGLSHIGLCLISNSTFYSNTLFQRLLRVFHTAQL